MRIPFITARREDREEQRFDELMSRADRFLGLVSMTGVDVRKVGEALYALGDHNRPDGTVRGTPHGAIEVLAYKTRDGQQEIANAIRSLAAALRENAAVLRTGGLERDRAEREVTKQVERQRDAVVFQAVNLRRPLGAAPNADFVLEARGPVAIFPDQVIDISPHTHGNGAVCVITTSAVHEGNSWEWNVAGSLVEVLARLKAVAR